jgi:hypothetical protein
MTTTENKNMNLKMLAQGKLCAATHPSVIQSEGPIIFLAIPNNDDEMNLVILLEMNMCAAAHPHSKTQGRTL